MNGLRSIWEKFREIKPAGKVGIVVVILLAQCCICILPFYALNAADGDRASAGETYIVGADIQPGLYAAHADAEADGCSWARLGDSGAVIATDRSAGDATIRVAAGDYALQTDCAISNLAD